MLRKFILIFFILFTTSCNMMRESGLIRPSLKRSKNIKVMSAEFDVKVDSNNEIQAYYNIFIEFTNMKATNGKFIVLEFQNPQDREDFSTITYEINELKDIMNIRSDVVYGLQSKKGYLVKISLANDEDGKEKIETIEQYVRSGVIPPKTNNVD